MKIRTLIVDDEPLARQLIRSLLSEENEIEIIKECSDGEEALLAIKKYNPHLMFLDIRMPGLSGFDVLEKVDRSLMPYVIFVTAYDQYAIRAFEIHALDYILKPFEKDRFFASLKRAKTVIRQQELSRLTDKIIQLVKSNRGEDTPIPDTLETDQQGSRFLRQIMIRNGKRLSVVDTADIVWLEAANQYVRIHTLTGSHLVSKSLDALQRQLDPQRFFRIHRSAIVQASFIKGVQAAKNGTYLVQLSTGRILKLSRRRRNILPGLLKYSS
ncbi:MAG: LytTR family DNA-binding domain-containing protein [Candidatus Aminicenantes bacterium]|jgi:two-component system LytT family response regulator